MTSSPILVAGATGTVGSAVTAALLARGIPVRAGTRNPDAYRAPGDGATPVALDLADPRTFGPALNGVAGAFFLTFPGDTRAAEHLDPFIDAANARAVDRLVLMTALGVNQAEAAPLHAVESHLRAATRDFVILRPNWFMENFHPGFFHAQIEASGTFAAPAGDAKVSFISVTDIADAVAAVLTEEGHRGREYDLTGPQSLDHHQAAAMLSEAAGREIRYQPVSDEDAREGMIAAGWPEASAQFMIHLFQAMRAGVTAPVTDHVSTLTGRPARSFADFAAHHRAAFRG
jgi:uncharacterized protein YbjT (DUF2867 family)